MKDKILEKAIKNLQKIIDKRKGADQIEEAIANLEESNNRLEQLEKKEQEIPLPILTSIYFGISSGPWWALGGFAIGKIIEETAARNETFSKLANGFLRLIHETNRDSKKEKV